MSLAIRLETSPYIYVQLNIIFRLLADRISYLWESMFVRVP